MNCEDVRDHLLDGGAPGAEPLREHVETCASCRELVSAPRLVGSLSAAPAEGDLTGLRQLVHEDLAGEAGILGRLRSLSSNERRLVWLAVAAVVVLLEASLLARADLHLLTFGQLLPTLLPLGCLALAGAWLALRPLHERALPQAVMLSVVLLSLVTPLVLSFFQPSTLHPKSLLGTTDDVVKYVAICLSHGAALAALVWLTFSSLDRGGFGFARYAAGAAASVVAICGLTLHCPIGHSTHWLLGHAGVGFVVLTAIFLGSQLRRTKVQGTQGPSGPERSGFER